MKEIYFQYYNGLYIKFKQKTEFLWDKFFLLDGGKWVYQNAVDYYSISVYECDSTCRKVKPFEINYGN